MLPNIFKPHKSIKSNLIRIGPKKDGGYVIDKRVIKKTDNIVTFGLNDDWCFEKEFLKRNKNCKVLAYDHTVNLNFWIKRFKNDVISFIQLKKLTPKKILSIFKYIDYSFFFSKKNKHYQKKIVANKKKDNESTIERILKNLQNILLKVDIEGDEYSIINDILRHKNKINLLIIEFHYVLKNFRKLKKFLLNSNFKIIHIHANNFGGKEKNGIPTTLEITLLNKKKFKISNEKSNEKYPIKGLDYKNHKSKKEIEIKFND